MVPLVSCANQWSYTNACLTSLASKYICTSPRYSLGARHLVDEIGVGAFGCIRRLLYIHGAVTVIERSMPRDQLGKESKTGLLA